MRGTFAEISVFLSLFFVVACGKTASVSSENLFPNSVTLNSNVVLDVGTTIQSYSADVAARGIVIDPMGRTVVTGRHTVTGQYDNFFLTRFLSNGAVDTDFGTSGTTAFGFGTGGDLAHAVTMQADGKIIVVGRTDPSTNFYFDFAIARLNDNGTLDTTFNGTGKVTQAFVPGEPITSTEVGSTDIARAVSVQPDGKILVSGYSRWPHHTFPYHFAVLRLLSNGTLDTTFGTNGRVTTETDANDNQSYAMKVQSDGKIVLAGSHYNGSKWKVSVVRYLSDGSLDTSFSGDGILKFDATSGDDIPYQVDQDSSGRIVLAGESTVGGVKKALYARLLSNGELDTTFGTNGISVISNPGGDISITSLKLDSDGTIVAAGTSTTSGVSYFTVTRIDTTGTTDSSFYSEGFATETVYGTEDVIQSVYCTTTAVCIGAGRAKHGSIFEVGLFQFNAR